MVKKNDHKELFSVDKIKLTIMHKTPTAIYCG